MVLLMEQLKKEEHKTKTILTMLTKIQQLFNLYHRLASKVNCVCNRPNFPAPPAEDGNYFLQISNGEWTWVSGT